MVLLMAYPLRTRMLVREFALGRCRSNLDCYCIPFNPFFLSLVISYRQEQNLQFLSAVRLHACRVCSRLGRDICRWNQSGEMKIWQEFPPWIENCTDEGMSESFMRSCCSVVLSMTRISGMLRSRPRLCQLYGNFLLTCLCCPHRPQVSISFDFTLLHAIG